MSSLAYADTKMVRYCLSSGSPGTALVLTPGQTDQQRCTARQGAQEGVVVGVE